MSETTAIARRRGGLHTSMRLRLLHLIEFENDLDVSLLTVIAGLAGAAGIVYVATRFGSHNHRQLPAAEEPTAIETTGVSLVK
ncbi:MAG: hypothetical protein JO054_11780 [Actinobacteria bacterium]|nr:hypothetical protein [Actinomycetota bacterium]